MLTDDEILEAASKDGSLDNSVWPGLLERLLPRLDNIVHNDFPIPSIPLHGELPPSLNDPETPFKPDRPSSQDSSQSSQTTNKENAPPPRSPPSRPPVPPFSATSTPTHRIPDSQPSSIPTPDGALPPQLLSMLTFIQHTLRTFFSATPPHTVQRFAELILRPRQHYRTLPSYLRALDRVVTVSSGADMFPLPEVSLPNSTLAAGTGANGALLNGTTTTSFSLGSDESLGGALLTPIPWLRDHSIRDAADRDDPLTPGASHHSNTGPGSTNGTPSASPQRDAGAVTQGELLRQEQEAGVVPVAQTTSTTISPMSTSPSQGRQTRSATAAASNARAMVAAEDEAGATDPLEQPHARGPDLVGMEDMGPQEGGAEKGKFDVEAAVGRSVGAKVDEGMGVEEGEGGGKKEEEEALEGDGDGDGDVVITDADGKTEDDAKSGENVGPDAVDTTAL